MLLRGKEICLRLVEQSDLGLLVQWRNRPEVWKHFFNTFPLSETTQNMWFQNLLQSSEKKLFMICTNKNKPIGTIGLDHIDFKNQSAEYGNVLIGEESFRGKGFALEATHLLLDYSFNYLNIHRIYLFCYSDNQKAISLYEKCGFVKEGVLRQAHFSNGQFRDLILMAILRDEYSKSN